MMPAFESFLKKLLKVDGHISFFLKKNTTISDYNAKNNM